MSSPTRMSIASNRSICRKSLRKGFTLAELLIALGILGVIATFTIPKVLQSQQDGKFKSIAKETIAMMSEAHMALKLNGQLSAATKLGDLTPYLNYIKVDTTTTIDNFYGQGSEICSPCVLLHNGARLQYWNNVSFGGTASTNGIWFHLDPDGVYSGTTQGPGKAISVFLYYNGKITDEEHILPGSQDSAATYNPNAAATPPWFSW